MEPISESAPRMDEARVEFEALFDEVLLGPLTSRVTDGDTNYVTITCNGVKLERAPVRYGSSTSLDRAIAKWLRHAKAYAKIRPGKILYWRCCPDVESYGSLYRVFSRLFIADRRFADEELSIHPNEAA